MTKSEIESYLQALEEQLLNKSEQIAVVLNRNWTNSFPNESAVYIFREYNQVCYVGETGSLRGRMNDILNTKNHTIRRNLGNAYFVDHPNYAKPSSKKGFCDELELLLNDRIQKDLKLSFLTISLGRKELEERLFNKYKPKYSIKGKRGTKS